MEDKNNLIVLEQLPVIKYKLEQLSVEIKKKVEDANKLVVNEDSVKEVKQVRANLTKEFNELEAQRKQVKQAIMSKYDEFEEIYRENVSNLYKQADSDLKEKINNVELSLKKQKEDELYDFAMEYIAVNDLQDFIAFDDIGLNITLSASMKSLKEEVIAFCEKVRQDIELINMEEYRDEILYEYKKNHGNFAQSKMNVIERHNALNQIAKKKVEEEIKQEEQKKIEEIVEEVVTAPVEIEEEQTFQFTITCTISQARKLKEWLNNEGIKYE